jgi:hypothetical protein
MTLHVRSHLCSAGVKLVHQKSDDLLDAWAPLLGPMHRRSAVSAAVLGRTSPCNRCRCHRSALDGALTLKVLVHYAGEGSQHACIERVVLASAPLARAKSRAVRRLSNATARPAVRSAPPASNS